MREIPQPSPLEPADYEPADIAAMQALWEGTANMVQQKRAIRWVVYASASAEDQGYRTNPYDHSFLSGKRTVGLEVLKLIKLNPSKFIESTE